jgi:hypothetical protein
VHRIPDIRDCLLEWVRRAVPADAARWLEGQCAKLAEGAPARALFLDFSGALRRTGKAPLPLRPEDLARADRLRPAWSPAGWTTDQAARIALVLSWPSPDAAAYAATLDQIFQSADLGELVALYQALPVLPHPRAHVRRCAEGVRTNMTDVFRAIAHGNPYPSEHLDEAAWNQMVLKALFVGVPLHPVHGLDARANAPLARMLLDYARERWAAKRGVSPELWRCVGPFADDAAVAAMGKVLAEGEVPERRAAALALRAAAHPRAKVLLTRHPVDLPPGCDWAHLSPVPGGVRTP